MPHESAIKIPVSKLVEFRSRAIYKNLEELAKSLAEHGQIEPLIVRTTHHPDGDWDGGYQIAAGTRRRRAAIIGGLDSLTCIVRELSDQQMVEIGIAENRDREDIHPLEEAYGLAELHDAYGMSIGEIAARFGRSDDYVYGRLKIAAMHESLRDAFVLNRFGVKGALVLAGVAENMQARVWAELSKLPDATLSASKITGFIRDRFLLRIASAPFPTDDPKLCEEAGACARCPKRTGVQACLFPEEMGADDRCTDVDCFTAKKRAFADALVERATEKNLRVLELKEAREVFKFGESIDTLNPDCAFVAVDGKVRLGEEGVRYRDLLAKNAPPVVIAINPGGGGVELYEKTAVAKSMRALKVPFVREWESVCLPKPGAKVASEKPDKAEAKLERAAAELAIDAICGKVEGSMCATKETPDVRKLAQLVALGAARNTWAQVQKAYIRKHKLDDGQTGGDANARMLAMLEAHIAKLGRSECIEFVFELALLREVFGAAGGPDVRAELFERGLAVTGLKFETFRQKAKQAQDGGRKDVSTEEKAPAAARAARGRTSPKRAKKEASADDGGEEASGAGGMCAVCSCTRGEPCQREKGSCTRSKYAELCTSCDNILDAVKAVVEEKPHPFRLAEVVNAVWMQDLIGEGDGDKSIVEQCLARLCDEDVVGLLEDGRYRRVLAA